MKKLYTCCVVLFYFFASTTSSVLAQSTVGWKQKWSKYIGGSRNEKEDGLYYFFKTYNN